MAGNYEGWKDIHDRLAMGKYVPYSRLKLFMDGLRYSGYSEFHSKFTRDRIRGSIVSLSIQPPFNRAARFPTDYYISEDDGEFLKIVRRLLAATDLPNVQTDGGVSLTDAQREFDNAVTDMLVRYSPMNMVANGFMNRNIFETRLELTWSGNIGG